MKILSAVSIVAGLATICLGTTSCVPLAVGAVGGYIIADDGVRLQSPITKDPPAPKYEY